MSFTAQERAALARLADVLIPAGDGFPSASEAGVCQQGLDAVLSARPDMQALLKDVLRKTAGPESAPSVEHLRTNDAAAFDLLAEFAAAAYFMNPAVLQAIGYSGQNAHPIDPRPDYLDDDLLKSVIRRGPIYRPTPDTTPGRHIDL